MNKKLYIAGATADREAMEALRPQFEAAGYVIAVCCPDSDAAAMNDGMEAEIVVLWISTKTGQQVYDIAGGRKDRNAATINIFAEPMALTAEQKKAVGRNRSVFAAVTPDVAKESVGLIGAVNTSTAAARASEKSNAVAAEHSENRTSDVVVEAPVDNVVVPGPSSDDEENTADSADTSPVKGLLMIVGTFIACVIIGNLFELKVNEWKTYIITAVAFFISLVATGGVISWREHNEKSFFSGIVLTLGWISMILYVYFFGNDLYTLIFD